jgi:hypothetical protein
MAARLQEHRIPAHDHLEQIKKQAAEGLQKLRFLRA